MLFLTTHKIVRVIIIIVIVIIIINNKYNNNNSNMLVIYIYSDTHIYATILQLITCNIFH